MHNNFYFLRQLSRQLKSELKGFLVGEVYSQQKNELTLCFYKKEKEFHIKAYLDSDFSCLYFPENINRAKRNSIDLFKKIYDLEILDIQQIENDRSLFLELQDDFKLLFKLHGNRSNIILLHKNEVVEIFRNSLKQDLDLDIDNLSKTINLDLDTFKAHHGNYKLIIPTFGKSFDNYFHKKNYAGLSIEKKYDLFCELIKYLEQPNYFIHYSDGMKPILSLYKIAADDIILENPVIALNKLFKIYIAEYSLQREKTKINLNLQQQIKKCHSYIETSESKLEKLKTAHSYSHIGDLIMANLHQIKKHTSEIELMDFYTNQPVAIKLKPSLSPQLNAEKYYRKAKSQQIEINSIQKNIDSKLQQIMELEEQLEKLQKIEKLKELKKRTILPQKKEEKPFHLVNFLGYEILIGKNARKNELLTFDIAKKDDLFLHAKDSPGSHVIIRSKNKHNFPEKVIEKAASYAAFYSKSKNESLIRVLYTPKKYVRKAKSLPAGTVIIAQEKVLLAKPESIKK